MKIGQKIFGSSIINKIKQEKEKVREKKIYILKLENRERMITKNYIQTLIKSYTFINNNESFLFRHLINNSLKNCDISLVKSIDSSLLFPDFNTFSNLIFISFDVNKLNKSQKSSYDFSIIRGVSSSLLFSNDIET